MSVYKLTLDVSGKGREIECFIKPGVLATVELGARKGRTKKPATKLNVLVDLNGRGAWVQASHLKSGGIWSVAHEGWVGSGLVAGVSARKPLVAKLSRVARPDAHLLKCLSRKSIRTRNCCTSYGSNCYVTCCNSCCSDPTACPGASCCS